MIWNYKPSDDLSFHILFFTNAYFICGSHPDHWLQHTWISTHLNFVTMFMCLSNLAIIEDMQIWYWINNSPLWRWNSALISKLINTYLNFIKIISNSIRHSFLNRATWFEFCPQKKCFSSSGNGKWANGIMHLLCVRYTWEWKCRCIDYLRFVYM